MSALVVIHWPSCWNTLPFFYLFSPCTPSSLIFSRGKNLLHPVCCSLSRAALFCVFYSRPFKVLDLFATLLAEILDSIDILAVNSGGNRWPDWKALFVEMYAPQVSTADCRCQLSCSYDFNCTFLCSHRLTR